MYEGEITGAHGIIMIFLHCPEVGVVTSLLVETKSSIDYTELARLLWEIRYAAFTIKAQS